MNRKRGVQDKVQAIMRGPERSRDQPLAAALHGASLVYGALSHIRNVLYRKGRLRSFVLACKVISIGNLAVGGIGKTPMTVYLAGQIQKMGLKPVVLSRGYKGAGEKRGLVVSDGLRVLCNSVIAGDEPYLMANLLSGVPVVIGRDRVAAGQVAVKRFKPDVVLLDDGYQHQRLHRDLDLLLLDANAPFGNGYLLPRGSLRESCAAMARADAVIFTRCHEDHYRDRRALEAKVPPVPVMLCSHRSIRRRCVPAGKRLGSSGLTLSGTDNEVDLTQGRLFAFSGLASNAGFQADIRRLGATVSGGSGFGDHHRYTDADIARIASAAQRVGSTGLITTDKDFVRLPEDARLPMPLFVLGVEIAFNGDQQRLLKLLEAHLAG